MQRRRRQQAQAAARIVDDHRATGGGAGQPQPRGQRGLRRVRLVRRVVAQCLVQPRHAVDRIVAGAFAQQRFAPRGCQAEAVEIAFANIRTGGCATLHSGGSA